jgi:hypothetical protein
MIRPQQAGKGFIKKIKTSLKQINNKHSKHKKTTENNLLGTVSFSFKNGQGYKSPK